MSKPIAIFYHAVFYIDNCFEMLPAAPGIISSQMRRLKHCGLFDAVDEFHVGINGGDESKELTPIFFPLGVKYHMHGLQCRNENRTILAMEEWVKTHPNWNVLYFHAKGSSRPEGDTFTGTWRECMMRHVVDHWRNCVADIENGYDASGSHWMQPPATPEGHYIFAGNFFWTTSNFLRTLPSLMLRDRIKVSGVDSKDSRYESEVYLGNGPKKPKVMDYHKNWNPSKIDTCRQLLEIN